MAAKVNSYLATLLITIVGSGAALLIMKVAEAETFSAAVGADEAGYADLKKSILDTR